MNLDQIIAIIPMLFIGFAACIQVAELDRLFIRSRSNKEGSEK